jgi:hypothetical protein
MESTHQFIGRIKNTVIIFAIGIAICFTNESLAQLTKRALFLGNSYTYYNDLPQLTVDIAFSAGDTLIVESNNPGGYTFEGHLGNTTSMGFIQEGNWDFVVLQQQSQMPAFPLPQVEVETFPFATQLNDSILAHSPCAETVFFMTWGRENGDQQNCANWPPVCTYEGMDDLLSERYMMMAEMNQGVVSPVGAVWRHLRENHPDIDLFSSDGSHPSTAGSYVAAICFYTTFFQKSPLDALFDYTVDNAQEATIRQVVYDLVFLQASDWYVGSWNPTADFTLSPVNSSEFTLTNTSQFADNFFYSIDGTNWVELTEPAVNITISEPGDYEISLIAQRCELNDTTTQTLQVSPNSVPMLNELDFNLYPNPTRDLLTIEIAGGYTCNEIIILNALGEIVLHIDTPFSGAFTTDLRSLQTGVYTIQVFTNRGVLAKQVNVN